ncbi:MAG: ECF-type sigma factor [Planctomycetaceae bacterium]|jgi:hypothetical protein
MPDDLSQSLTITHLLHQLSSEDVTVHARLFRFYHAQLLQIARKSLTGSRRRVQDEEDLVSIVLAEFLMTGPGGPIEVVGSREDVLWMLWARIQKRGRNMVRDERRQRRGRGRVRGDSVLGYPDDDHPNGGFDQFPGKSPLPEEAMALADNIAELHQRFFDCLGPVLEPVARLWLQGCTPAEIADQLDIGLSSTYRKLDKILLRFEQVFPGAKAPRTL